MHLKRREEVEKRKQCVTCTWTQTDHEATECHLTNCTGSTLDPTKFNHWQLQNVLRIYVGRNFGWQRPNYKMSLGKIMLAIPTFIYFLTSDALDFVVLVLNYFPSQKELCSSFCSCKKTTCTAFCSCAPYAFRFVSTKTICTTPPPLSEPWYFCVFLYMNLCWATSHMCVCPCDIYIYSGHWSNELIVINICLSNVERFW